MGPGSRGRRSSHGAVRGLSRPARTLREARLHRDDRGRRTSRLRHVLCALLEPAHHSRKDAAPGDNRRQSSLRGREGLAELHPHPHLPGRLPALARRDRALRRSTDGHASRRTQGSDAALRRDAAALARQLRGRDRAPGGPRLRRALSAAVADVPRLLRGRVRRAADRRRTDDAGQAAMAPARGPYEPARGATSAGFLSMVRTLVTGASGYIGSRLVRELRALGEPVGCVARDPSRVSFDPAVKVHRADMLDPESLSAIDDDYTTAYYLVHSMGRGGDSGYEQRDALA